MELFPIYVAALFVGGTIIMMANLPPMEDSKTFGGVVSPSTLSLLLAGDPAKLKFSSVSSTGYKDTLQVEAQTQTGLHLTFLRDTALQPNETQIRVSKTGWIGCLVFNFEGLAIRSVVLGNGMAYPPENFRGETRALAGRLYQRLYQLGRDSRSPAATRTQPPGPSPNLSG
jgi:hypothetical protein